MFAASLLAGAIADKLKSVIRFWCYGYVGMAIFSFGYLLIPKNHSLVWVVVINFVLHGMFLLAVKALYFAPIDEMYIGKSLPVLLPVLYRSWDILQKCSAIPWPDRLWITILV